MMIETVKTLLGIEDAAQDALLSVIIENTQNRLKALAGADSVPEQLAYIVSEVAVARFNRIGSEGTTQHSVADESLTFSADDFAPYMADIEAYRAATHSQVGVIRFI
jgi:hypothetical protein